MKETEIEVLRQIVSRTDKTGNEKVEMLVEFVEQQLKNCNLQNVSKRFDIDFGGNVLAGIEISNNKPKVFGAVNGWGVGISPDKCKITEKTD